MKEPNKSKRYIFDPLYNIIYLPNFIWDVIPSPELQRLREVRLCNINSLCLIGGANINRYEHAIGTCHLAQNCLDSWPLLDSISEEDRYCFLLAALLHDIPNAAFGHSVEYVEVKKGFDHQDAFKTIMLGEKKPIGYSYRSASLEQIFFGMHKEIPLRITSEHLEKIDEIISGKGRFGSLINSSIDLDNIDNVFRLAYHIGLVKSGEIPLKIARSIYTKNNTLVLRGDAIPLVEEWQKVRKKLYYLLLRNPEEFSAKCMLNEAIEIAKEKHALPFNWYDVDYELLTKLSKVSAETSEIISRLVKGDLYGCIGIFSTAKVEEYMALNDASYRNKIEDEISDLFTNPIFAPQFKSSKIAMHIIKDVNKTERQVQIQLDNGQVATIGRKSNQILIAVFFKNKDLNMYTLDNLSDNMIARIKKKVFVHISSVLKDKDLIQLSNYAEIQECK